MWVLEFTTFSEQRRLSWPWVEKTTFHIPNFEDKGRTHAYHNGIKVEPLWGNPSQACLSEAAIDRDRPRSRHNRLGLFICWVGHNCPVPSSPAQTPWSGAHWPNGMEKFTPLHWRQFVTAVWWTACLFHLLFTVFLSTILLVVQVVTAPQHSYY